MKRRQTARKEADVGKPTRGQVAPEPKAAKGSMQNDDEQQLARQIEGATTEEELIGLNQKFRERLWHVVERLHDQHPKDFKKLVAELNVYDKQIVQRFVRMISAEYIGNDRANENIDGLFAGGHVRLDSR